MSADKILIVEDQRLVARDIAFTLEDAGYEVVGMLSYGNEVIDRVAKLKPDLVLLDINILGPIDGVQVAEYLHRYWQTAVVFLTANSDDSTFDRAKKTCAYGFLIKPYLPIHLLTTVENAILTHRHNQAQITNLRRKIISALPHEINTVLNNILGLSEVITSEYDNLSDQEVFEFVTDIQTSAKRLHGFTQRYLFFAQLEVLLSSPDRFKSMARMEPVLYSADVITHLIKDLNPGGVREFSLDLCNDHLDFPLDFFHGLIKELIDNALRYSIANTPIGVATTTEGNYFKITIKNHAEQFDLDSISDNGAFVKSKSIFHDRQGSGLGLGIVYRILHLVEGTIVFSFSNSLLEIVIKLPLNSSVLQLD